MRLIQYEAPRGSLVIAPLGDIQWAGDKSDIVFDQLGEHVDRCLSLGAKFIGLGDYVDFMSPSNRESWKTGKFYDTARKVVDDKAKDLTDDLLKKILAPTKGHWLGLVSGHHYFPLKDGRTTDTYLAEQLGAHFLGEDTAMIRVVFQHGNCRNAIDIWMAHGRGNGQLPSAPINLLDRVSHYVDADIYVIGHQTKKCFASSDRMYPIYPQGRGLEPRLGHKTLHLVGAGGWTRGYKMNESTYVEQAIMRPVTLGAPIIRVSPKDQKDSRGIRTWRPNITVEA